MDGQRLGVMSLRADAAYCAAAALHVCALAPLLAPELGIATLWCFAAGVVAALGIGASAATMASAALTVLLAAVAVEVAAFAVSQAVSIRRLRGTRLR